tara:strand:+ start:507 stop:1154 length:648 start_codon:yes stop_codon:yes gene_type:complete
MSKISLKHSGGNVVSLNVPTSAPTSADVAFKLPNADGSANQLLKTDGSGNLGWATGGKILQLQSVTKTDTQSITPSSKTDISGLSITITPASASSKFYITGKVQCSLQYTTTNLIHIDMNGTEIGAGTAASSRPVAHTGLGYISSQQPYGTYGIAVDFLVAASDANAHTIKLQGSQPDSSGGGGKTMYINRSQNDSDDVAGPRLVSTLTVMEVAG